MGFEFKSDQPEQKLVDSKTTLSVTGTSGHTIPVNATLTELVGEQAVATVVEENLTQDIFAEGEEERLAIQFIEENALYTKFMLWCGIQDQLKNLKDSLATPTE
jgi:hypothetical protein